MLSAVLPWSSTTTHAQERKSSYIKVSEFKLFTVLLHGIYCGQEKSRELEQILRGSNGGTEEIFRTPGG